MSDPGELAGVGLPAVELPNVGPGPDPCSLRALADDHDALVVLLQRDHHCTNCREQVQTVAERYDDFRALDAEVASVVPEPRERVATWQDRYDLPYPLLGDPDAALGSALDQPVRFGPLGRLSDFLGRMPEALVFDCRDAPELAWVHQGSSTFDRPAVEDLLAAVEDALAGD
jgi:peroxiredoxin Q/BCP